MARETRVIFISGYSGEENPRRTGPACGLFRDGTRLARCARLTDEEVEDLLSFSAKSCDELEL